MKSLATLLMTFMLFGCVAKSPQQVQLTPELVTPNLITGQGMSIQLDIEDVRQNKVLGSRGGVYEDTSLITLQDGSVDALAAALEGKLQEAGFNLEDASETRWLVELKSLTYDVVDVTSAREDIRVNTELQLTIYKGNSRYRNDYKAFRTMEVLTIPTDEKNASLINSVVSDAINSLLQDSKITEFMQTH
jgi:uncharacterized lipoprotein